VDARSRSSRTEWPRPYGQHFLRSERVANELVRDAGVAPTEHVVEIGAGRGRLTEPLARKAGSVTAIEIDPELAEELRHTFHDEHHVRIVCGDVMRVPAPHDSWRAFGNIPFALTTAMLRRLLDEPAGGLQRADLLIQFEAARKRSAVDRSTLLSLGWLPWWELSLARRIPMRAFDPPPTVDAGLLVVTRRPHALLEPEVRPAFVAMIRRAFDQGSRPVRRSLRRDLPPKTWKRLARDRGIPVDASPTALDVWDWVEVFKTLAHPSTTSGRWVHQGARTAHARPRRSDGSC
jgi:23S rRNA (adenine-N6)-dimethyltransferase